MNFNQFFMANSIVKELEPFYDLFTPILLVVIMKVHTLNPADNGIRQAKLTEVHPSNIS